jgi:putative alpha-1,2-mannosidase
LINKLINQEGEMSLLFRLLVVLGAFFHIAAALQACEQVNSFIATSGLAYGYGGINPAAQFPYGAVRLGPDSTSTIVDLTYRHFSGYNYQDSTVRAFSHTHLVGAGVNDLGSVGVMPISITKNITSVSHDWWWSDFDKVSETASPGFYSVFLDGPQTKLTSWPSAI